MASGSVRKLTLDGVTFNVAADANIAMTPESEVEAIRHSGGNSFKITKMPAQAEGAKLILSDAEYDTLKTIAKKTTINMSYTKQDGSVWVCQGMISAGNYESEENSCEVTMFPESAEWTLFGV